MKLNMKLIIAILALLYVIWPIDLIPDIIPVIGYIDDIVVVICAVWYWIKR